MTKKVTIPITNHSTSGICTSYYTVGYKLSGATNYTTLSPFYLPDIEITNLLPGVTYNVRIVRHCCDGLESTPLLLDVNT